MKILNFVTIITCACLIISGCKKEKPPSIEDIDVRIDLLDTNHNSTRNFNHGEDMIFKYVEYNKTNESINYYTDNCPTFYFGIYDMNDNFLGDAIPFNWGCTDILSLSEILPKESKSYEINWFNDTTNIALPVGNYKLKFNNTITIYETKERKTYNLEINFKVD